MTVSQAKAPDERFRAMTDLFNPFSGPDVVAARPNLNWEDLWDLCSFHALRPLLIQRLKDRAWSNQLPAPTGGAHVDFERQQAFTVLQRTAEIVALSRAFEAGDVPVVFFKGAVLGIQIYDGAQHREFNDIDLVVRPPDRRNASRILRECGFRPVVDDENMQKAFFDYGGQRMFVNVETGSIVDFHWNFSGNQHFPVSVEQVIENRVMLNIGGSQVPAPSSEDLALILAGHGQKEGWGWFGWALDFAQFAARHPSLDWAKVAGRAKAAGSPDSVLTAMLLTERLFGTTIDERLLEQARKKPSIVRGVDEVITFYVERRQRAQNDDLRASFSLCDTPGQRAKAWLQLIFRRTIGDYEAMPLPPPLWRIYHATRPFRLLMRTMRGSEHAPSTFWETKRERLRGLVRDNLADSK